MPFYYHFMAFLSEQGKLGVLKKLSLADNSEIDFPVDHGEACVCGQATRVSGGRYYS